MELMKSLTAEEAEKLERYFKANEPSKVPASRFFRYGKWKHATGKKIDSYEKAIMDTKKKKQESYKRDKIREIQDNAKAVEGKFGKLDYYLVRETEYESGRTMVISMPTGTLDKPFIGSVLIEEASNPSFYAECKAKYHTQTDYSAVKEYQPAF